MPLSRSQKDTLNTWGLSTQEVSQENSCDITVHVHVTVNIRKATPNNAQKRANARKGAEELEHLAFEMHVLAQEAKELIQ
jgi:hypothetical protein